MNWWLDYLIYTGAQAISLFNTVTLLWLGLTVLLTGDRRKPATIAGGVGLLLGALFFLGHTLLIAHTVDLTSPVVNVVWRVMWFVAVIAPFFWGLTIFYYSGDPAAGKWVRRALTAAAFFMIMMMAFVLPLPSLTEFMIAPVVAPVIAWVYVPYLFLCFTLPLISLRRRQTRGRDPFRRARPWLIGAAAMLTLAVVSFAFAAYTIVPRAIPIYILTADVVRELYLADGVVGGFIALSIILLGRAVVANSVITERLQSNRGFFMRWRNVVGVAVLGSGFVALLYTLPIKPIYSLMLTAMLAVVAYAMFNWRQYVEHAEFMKRLDPFVKSLHLHDHLLASGPDSWRESRELFTALCRDALGADRACLLFDASMPGGVPPRIDYRWRAEYDDRLNAPITARSSEWTRLDDDHWLYALADSRGAIGRLVLGPKINDSDYTMQELQVAAACGERILDALAGEQLARVAVNLLRQRIAQVQVMSAQHKRILHDEALPQIHLALLKVEALRALDQLADSSRDQKLDEASQALTRAHRRVSALVREMSNAAPTRLESEGLVAALRSALDHDFHDSFDHIAWQTADGVNERAKQLPLFVSEVMFYAAQEAIRNAARHGRGGDAQRPLNLAVFVENGAGLRVIIDDDGVGRPAARSVDHGGSGLLFHAAMLAVVGGTLSVEDRSGGGTRVTIAVQAD